MKIKIEYQWKLTQIVGIIDKEVKEKIRSD